MKTLLIIFISSSFCMAQNFIYTDAIGKFQQATSFSFSLQGFFFVTDQLTNEINKVDTLGKKQISAGGYGWSEQSFDFPADVYAWTLRAYVADKNNGRIQILDKDLNFISTFNPTKSGEDIVFNYPVGIGLSHQGDYFILDSDNSRILKYDLNGRFLLEIGNFDSGGFSLSEPKSLAVSPNGKIYVLDSNGVIVFDQFGMGLTVYKSIISAENLNITNNWLVVNSSEKIQILNLNQSNKSMSDQFKVFVPKENGKIIEAIIHKRKLYILTETEILIYLIEG